MTEVLQQGACQLLAQAVEVELTEFLAEQAHIRDAEGRQMIVQNAHVPERQIQMGIGAIAVQAPRMRDRRKGQPDQIRFTSTILPRYLRRNKSLEELVPWLYLKRISTGDCSEA